LDTQIPPNNLLWLNYQLKHISVKTDINLLNNIYIPSNIIGHYLTYVPKINDRWEIHDGLSTDKKNHVLLPIVHS